MYVSAMHRNHSVGKHTNYSPHPSALGHPLGCTGVRQVVTALSELKRSKQQIAITVSFCDTP